MVVDSVDVDTQTRWSKNQEYDRRRFSKDEEVMENLILGEATKAGLSPAILQVIVNQYFFADPYQREMDIDVWVKRVISRKSVDYFPSGWAVRKVLERVT